MDLDQAYVFRATLSAQSDSGFLAERLRATSTHGWQIPGRLLGVAYHTGSSPKVGLTLGRGGYVNDMFAFFSSRIGCLGSLLISAILTALLWLVFAH